MSTFTSQSTTAADEKRTEAARVRNLNTLTSSATAISEESAVAVITEQQAQIESAKYLQDVQKYAENIGLAAHSKLSEMIGVVWDEFEKLSRLGKIFAIIGTILLVGAVGYFSWKHVAGNWPQIKEFVANQLKKAGENVSPGNQKAEANPVVKSLLKAFEGRDDAFDLDISTEQISTLIQFVCKNVTAGVTIGFLEVLKKSQVK